MIWVPALPVGPPALWVRDCWYVPQASSFWRRTCVERVGGFRENLHYAMDMEFGLRLAVSGVLPLIITDELAVRCHTDDAKSADKSRWLPELAVINAELVQGSRRSTSRARMPSGSDAAPCERSVASPLGRFIDRGARGELTDRRPDPERWEGTTRRARHAESARRGLFRLLELRVEG